MGKRLILILLIFAISSSLFAIEMGQSLVAVNFAGGPSYYIGFSSTKVDSRNHIASDITDLAFALNPSGDMVASFYIYWKVYVAYPVQVDITSMTDLASANGSGSTLISYNSTSTVNGRTLSSGSSSSYTVYEESSGSKTAPRINSEQITLKLDLDESKLEEISSLDDSDRNFSGTMTIKLTAKA